MLSVYIVTRTSFHSIALALAGFVKETGVKKRKMATQKKII